MDSAAHGTMITPKSLNRPPTNMGTRDFCLWLHGYLELTPEYKGLSAEQVKIIEDHLDLVFKKETPERFPSCPSLPLPNLPTGPGIWPLNVPTNPWLGDYQIIC